MLAALLSLDLGLDLGSSRTRVVVRGGDVVSDVPTCVAVRVRRSGRSEVIAIGAEAEALLGREPEGLKVIRPVRCGRVVEPAIAETLVTYLVRAAHGGRTWIRPRIAVAVPDDAPAGERRALLDVATSAGARTVAPWSSQLLAARGAGLDAGAVNGHLVVDMGAGATRIAVLSGDQVVASTSLEVAGDVLDGAILRMLKREHELWVGTSTAEALRRRVGAAPEGAKGTTWVAGRCLRRGLPRAVDVEDESVRRALMEPIEAIGAAIRGVLARTPPDLARDVADHGLILCGGAALLQHVDVALRGSTGLAVLTVERPDRAVAHGLVHYLNGQAGPISGLGNPFAALDRLQPVPSR